MARSVRSGGESKTQAPCSTCRRRRSVRRRRSILRLPAVKARTGLSRATIYARMADGTFPKQISLGERAVGWIEDEIDEWLTQRIEQPRKARQDRHSNGRLKAGRSEQSRGEG